VQTQFAQWFEIDESNGIADSPAPFEAGERQMANKKTVKKKTTTTKKVMKKTTKKPLRTEKPKVVAIVACDSIMQQLPAGKPALVGVFDKIQVTDPTKPFRPFTLMTKLFGGNGKFQVGMRIEAPSGVTTVGSDEEIDCDPEDIHQGTMTIGALDVSKPGMVRIYVTIDGKKIGNPCPIKIVHVKQKEASKSD